MKNREYVVGVNVGFFLKKILVTTSLMFCISANAAVQVNPRNNSDFEHDTSRSVTSAVLHRNTGAENKVGQRNNAGRSRVATRSKHLSDDNVKNKTRVARKSVIVTKIMPVGNKSRSAVRASTTQVVGANIARSAVNRQPGLARATAVYDDVSKIGGGYSACRESYATCMDQLCAKANDTYRRCFCSDKFTSFRDTELAMDQAQTLLQQFEDNNLNAVDKTAAEVSAMYSATVGEQAIKRDTSAATSILANINDLISGKTKVSAKTNSTSLGIMDVSFDSDDDPWGATSSLFDNAPSNDISALEGAKLFAAAQKQCIELTRGACSSDAVFNMSKSSYNILIAQDCNAYEKNINKKKEAVANTVRQAEKYLRDARLEEYRNHNSADVNECITKVKSAILSDVACGANYKRCLDYTGAYIDVTTGDPLYTPRLFKLEELITLNGSGTDVLSQNSPFNKFLDSKRMYADSALSTCRDIADNVWTEFKRSALIEIAQSQSAKIEEVKMSCVSTMAECYDAQSGALKDFDTTTAGTSGALAASAARTMCADKVTACAALFGNNSSCQFDGNGKLTSPAASCGIDALLNFVNTVDTTRMDQGCETALDNKLHELCTPTGSNDTRGYPWLCRLKTKDSVKTSLENYARTYCTDKNGSVYSENSELSSNTSNIVDRLLGNMSIELSDMLADECIQLDGYWQDIDENSVSVYSGNGELNAFYSAVFAGDKRDDYKTYGKCLENTTRSRCLAWNTDEQTVATYDEQRNQCNFTTDWYVARCEAVGGYFENAMCYIPNGN